MNEFHWIAVAVVAVISSARITRLLTFDEFPPIKFFRDRFQNWTDEPPRLQWQAISYCPWCMSPWVTIGVVLWGWLTDWQDAWWLVNGITAASYLAAIVMVHDGDDD